MKEMRGGSRLLYNTAYQLCNFIKLYILCLFLLVHVSIRDQSCPLPRARGYSQPFFLECPQVVEAIPPVG